MTETLENEIIPVKELLSLPNLTIPDYQRPYKWTERNVSELFNDLNIQSAYRLGTVVFHKDQKDNLNIVDGQQRTLTLVLAVQAILDHRLKDIQSTICLAY